MRKAIQIAATFAIIAFGMTSCQKENVESTITPQNTENKVVTQDTSEFNLREGILVAEENVPQSVREGIATSEEEKALAKNLKTGHKTLSAGKKVTVYGSLYCENKGGDDGNTLEIYGNVSVNTVWAHNKAVTHPPIAGSSVFKNGGPLIFIKQGETRFINAAVYQVAKPLLTQLKLAAHLHDDDRNSDDGKWRPNPSDFMGNTYRYVDIHNFGVKTQWMKYANGNQIVWMRYTIAVQ